MNPFPHGCAAGLRLGALPILCCALIWNPSTALAQEAEAPQDASAEARAEGRRILVGKLDGDKDNQARAWIIDGILNTGDHVLIDDAAALTIDSKASQTDIATAAAEQTADVVIVGSSRAKGKGFSGELSVYDGVDGHLIKTVKVTGKNQAEYEQALLSGAALAPPIGEAQGWPRQPEEPVAADAGADAEKEAPNRPSPLRVLVGARVYSRSLRYTDGIWNRDPAAGYKVGQDYTLAASPMPRAEVHWYPAAHFTGKWPSHLGAVLGYELGLGSSVRFNAVPLEQSHNLFYGGLRGRIPWGKVTLGVQATFTSHNFSVSGDENIDGPDPLFPDVSYSQIELGGDLEWRNEKMILGGHASFNLVLDPGQIGSSIGAGPYPWFPETSTMAGDFGVYVGWQLSRVLDLLAGTDIRAYGMDFGMDIDDLGAADPTQVVVAGGATDRYTSFWAGLAIHWPAPDQPKPQEESPADGGGSDDGFGDFDDF